MRIEHAQNYSDIACLFVPVFSNRASWQSLPDDIFAMLEQAIVVGNFDPSSKNPLELFNVCGVQRLVFIPMGKTSQKQLGALRLRAAVIPAIARKYSLDSVGVYFCSVFEERAVFAAFLQAVYLADDKVLFKNEKEMARLSSQKLSNLYVFQSSFDDAVLAEISIESQAIAYARCLTASSSAVIDISYIEKISFDLAAAHASINVKSLGRDALQQEGMNLHLAVGRGSAQEPKLIEIAYEPAECNEDPIVLVAKGVVFDTGGVNLKPAEGMKDMSMDMGGAAVVLATMKALAELGVKRKVIALLAMTDNVCGPESYLQSEIITASDGTTVEIAHTDAEGRLILADALVYAKRFHPSSMIDVATLTLGTIQSLGYETASLYSNSHSLSADLQHASLGVDESIWRMPINGETRKMIQSKVADIKNLGDPVACKAGAAAAFLDHFVSSKTAWAHLDIAGVTKRSPNALTTATGYTGFGVRLLLEYVREQVKK